MRTPMQELIEWIYTIISALPDGSGAKNQMIIAKEKAESMLEKEKEFTTNFAMDYVFSGEVGCAIWADGPPELDIDKSAKQYYEQTFNTKEK